MVKQCTPPPTPHNIIIEQNEGIHNPILDLEWKFLSVNINKSVILIEFQYPDTFLDTAYKINLRNKINNQLIDVYSLKSEDVSFAKFTYFL